MFVKNRIVSILSNLRISLFSKNIRKGENKKIKIQNKSKEEEFQDLSNKIGSIKSIKLSDMKTEKWQLNKINETIYNTNENEKNQKEKAKQEKQELGEKLGIVVEDTVQEKETINRDRKEKKDSNKKKKVHHDYLFGLKSVEMALRNKFRKSVTLFLSYRHKDIPTEKILKFIDLAKKQKINVTYINQGKIDLHALSSNNDGVMLKCDKREFSKIKKFHRFSSNLTKKTGNIVVIIDQITDTKIFSNLINSCVYFGVDRVIVNQKNSSILSPLISSLSYSSTEAIEIYSLKYVNIFLKEALGKNWNVVTLSNISNESQEKNKTLFDFKLSEKENTILIIGDENIGLGDSLKKTANINISLNPCYDSKLTGKFPFNIVESLDPSANLGIVLSHLKITNKV